MCDARRKPSERSAVLVSRRAVASKMAPVHDKSCYAAAAIVQGLHSMLHMDPETAAGLAHFYAATSACSASGSAAPFPFDQRVREILARRPDIDPDRWLAERPIRGQHGKGAHIFFAPPGCPQHAVTRLTTSKRTIGEPHGDMADKAVCEAEATLAAAPCMVVSVGSDGDVAFEEAVHRRWPQCAIKVFDGTLTGPRAHLARQLPDYVRFYPQNFGPRSWQHGNGQSVAILKIDCERCEHEALLPWISHVCTQQILVELHPQGFADDGNRTASLLAALSETHAPFFGLHNHKAGTRLGGRYAEIAWRLRRPCAPPGAPLPTRTSSHADHNYSTVKHRPGYGPGPYAQAMVSLARDLEKENEQRWTHGGLG